MFAILKISPEIWEESNKHYLEENNEDYLQSLSGLTTYLKFFSQDLCITNRARLAKQVIDTDKLVNVINDIETILEDNEGTLIDMAELIVTD